MYCELAATLIVPIMIPAGYMAKSVASRPDWLKADNVTSIYSVASCVSDDFGDYIQAWKHNGFWLFDSPSVLKDVAREQSIPLEATTLFYYEACDLEFDDQSWLPSPLERPSELNVEVPPLKELRGFDVVTVARHNQVQCSPLSCNSMAEELLTNQYCLLKSLDEAKEYISAGRFAKCEPGTYQIFAVYSVPWA